MAVPSTCEFTATVPVTVHHRRLSDDVVECSANTALQFLPVTHTVLCTRPIHANPADR
jgi:hypothetical protein